MLRPLHARAQTHTHERTHAHARAHTHTHICTFGARDKGCGNGDSLARRPAPLTLAPPACSHSPRVQCKRKACERTRNTRWKPLRSCQSRRRNSFAESSCLLCLLGSASTFYVRLPNGLSRCSCVLPRRLARARLMRVPARLVHVCVHTSVCTCVFVFVHECARVCACLGYANLTCAGNTVVMCVHAHHTSAPTRMHTTAEFLARVSRERAAQRSNDEVVAPAAGGAGGGRKADRSQAERALQQELRAAKEQTEVFDRRASVEVAMCVCVRACVCLCTCMVYLVWR